MEQLYYPLCKETFRPLQNNTPKRMKKAFSTVFFLFCSVGLIYCQDSQPMGTTNKKAIKLYNDAASYYDVRNNEAAIDLLKRAIKEDSNFVNAQGMLGYIYDDMGNEDAAINQYRKVIRINPKFFPNIFFSLGKLEMDKGYYADAEAHLNYFLEGGKGTNQMDWAANQMITDCKFGIEAIKHPVLFTPMNMGASINTKFSEYFPTMTVDGTTLLFTRRLERMGQMQGEEDYNEDLYLSFKQDEQWTKAMNAGPSLNSEYMEGASTISANGNVLIFVSDRPGGYGSCDLYYSLRIGNAWGRPQNMGAPINTRNWESQPCLSADGLTLYFVRGIIAAHAVKNEDIYVTKLGDSTWGVPVKLSDTINTQGKEECPFISPDNQTLYFASDGHPGMGGTDLYMSRRLPNGRWGIPLNLGYPINTAKNETGIVIDPNGRLAYFSSDREGGYGGMDIYSFTLYDSIRPQPVTYMKGKVFDANTKDPLIADFTLIDLATGAVVSQSNSRPVDGTFLVCLPVNKNYALNVSRKGYLFYSENFSFKDVKASYEHPFLKDVPLQQIDTGASIVLNNVFFPTNKFDLSPESDAELNKLVAFMKNNPTIKIQISGHTDNVGTPDKNKILSENRAKSVYTYLIDHSIGAERLTYKGYGQTVPVATNDTPEGRQLNRRTEMKITAK